jgi:hypothetical protein
VKYLVLFLLLISSATAEESSSMRVSLSTLRELMKQNQELREDNKRLDAQNDEISHKYNKLVGMQGSCT